MLGSIRSAGCGILLSLLFLGCEAKVPATVVMAPVAPVLAGADPLSAEERLLALITADNPRLQQLATSLAHLGNAAVTREASVRLVRLARAADAKEEDERHRTAELTPVLTAMAEVGGPEVAAYAFGLAEDGAAGWERRRLAIDVLARTLDPGDIPGIERRRRAEERLGPRPVARFPSVGSAVERMRVGARACYQRALKDDPDLRASVRLLVVVDRGGAVTSKLEGTPLPLDFARCLTGTARAFEGLEEPCSLTIPLAFSVQR